MPINIDRCVLLNFYQTQGGEHGKAACKFDWPSAEGTTSGSTDHQGVPSGAHGT